MAHTPSEIDGSIPLESQVGGHPGVRTSEDGSLLIKPALPREVAFYQSVAADPRFAPLRPFVPKFYGTLRLEGKVDESAAAAEQDGALKVRVVYTQSLVLENLSHAFSKPNILDIKLGTVLYDDDASAEKRARMEKTARETTSLETGVRLTGFQVYDLVTGRAVNTPKSYGKSITAADLPDGLARFFPIAPDAPAPQAIAPGAAENDDAPGDQPMQGTGLPADVLAPLLESLREDIAEIRAALEEIHLRMVGASLLVVYEADWERARAGLEWLEEGGDEDEDEDEDEDDEEDAEGKQRVGPPYAVKLIDFAHTKIVPGAGPDEGVLKGIDTVLQLLDGRIEQVKAAAAAKEKTAAA
ncbi:SAICAR synthase-like protein [Cubamyces menziesii]|nr:SAICAR synthase-like protein [Cubamyces menziesii]